MTVCLCVTIALRWSFCVLIDVILPVPVAVILIYVAMSMKGHYQSSWIVISDGLVEFDLSMVNFVSLS